MKISKEVKERLKTEITFEILANLRKTRLDQEDLIKRLIDEGNEKIFERVNNAGDFKSGIAKQVFDQIPTPKNGEIGLPGQSGKNGEPGKRGEKGQDAPLFVLSEEDKKEIAGNVDITQIIRYSKTDITNLIRDIKTGKIRPPNAGIDIKELISEFDKYLGSTDWRHDDPLSGVTLLDAATYTIKASDNIIHSIYSLTGISTITLAGSDGKEIRIKDGGGNARTNNITIDTDSGTIDGRAAESIISNYGWAEFYKYDGNWFISQEFAFTF